MTDPSSPLDYHNSVGGGCMSHIFSQNVVHIGGETKKNSKNWSKLYQINIFGHFEALGG